MKPPIVFFDGPCTLCNTAVAFLLRHDDGRPRYASLQSETARRLLPEKYLKADTVVLRERGKLYEKSEAVFRLVTYLKKYRWLGLFGHLPRRWLNAVYDFIAAHRYRWFGRTSSCRLALPGEAARLLA